MLDNSQKLIIRIFQNKRYAWIVLTLSLFLTISAYFITKNIVKEKRSQHFSFRAIEIKNAIVDRMDTYVQALWGGVGLFNSSPKSILKRDVFSRYVKTLNINKHWPGIQGIGFSVPVSSQDLTKHESEIASKGFKGFRVRPHGKRSEYSSIIYLEPFDWRNKRAHGYDMWSNKMRRNAMRRAKENGVAATSGIITLVQETSLNVQKGFLTYLPVYSTGDVPKTLLDRQKYFRGWVYSPFRAGDLMKGIIGQKDKSIDFQIFDGDKMNTNSLLYSTIDDEVVYVSGELKKVVEIELQGRKWKIKFSTPESSFNERSSFLPLIILILGAIVDLVLFYALLSFHYLAKSSDETKKVKT